MDELKKTLQKKYNISFEDKEKTAIILCSKPSFCAIFYKKEYIYILNIKHSVYCCRTIIELQNNLLFNLKIMEMNQWGL